MKLEISAHFVQSLNQLRVMIIFACNISAQHFAQEKENMTVSLYFLPGTTLKMRSNSVQ
jgi:hypothetical protein